jgi:ADP-heptose:LPS heptosyltransferase
LTFVTKPAYEPLLHELSPRLVVPILDPDKPLQSAWRKLRGQPFDWIIDLHGSVRSLILTHLLRSRRQTRVMKSVQRRRAMVRHKRGLNAPLSSLKSYHDALSPLGLALDPMPPRLALSHREQDAAAAQRALHPATLAIGWGARWPAKAVPKERWEDLLTLVPATTLPHVVLFGEPGEREAMQTFITQSQKSNIERTFAVTATSNWREVMVNLSACAVYVGSDSGLMHVADALGLPTFGLFGPTHPALGFPPSGPQSRAFHAGTWCSPCHRHGAAPCFRGHRYCFDELDLNLVTSALRSTLADQRMSR